MRKSALLLSLGLFLTGCQKYFISIAQDKIDASYLASSYVATPDPRQEHPPLGDRLIIEWQVPKELIKNEPSLHLHVLYKNYTEAFFVYPICYPLDYAVYTLLDEEYKEKRGILTYEAKILTKEGSLFREWKHQLWTQLIVLKEPSVLPSVEPQREGREWNEEKGEVEESMWEDFPPSQHEEDEAPFYGMATFTFSKSPIFFFT